MGTNNKPEVWALYSFYIQTVCYFVDLPAYCNKNKNYISICRSIMRRAE